MKKILYLLALLMIVACHSNSRAYRMEASDTPLSRSSSDASMPQDQVFIYGAELEIEGQSPDSLVKKVVDLANQYGGYAQSTSKQRASVKVPALRLDEYISDLESRAEMTKKEVNAVNITLHYTDTKIRLENDEKLRQRYLLLLDKAKDVKDAIAIEAELAKVSARIERYKRDLKTLDTNIQYSTVNVECREKTYRGPLTWVFYGLYKGISYLFVF